MEQVNLPLARRDREAEAIRLRDLFGPICTRCTFRHWTYGKLVTNCGERLYREQLKDGGQRLVYVGPIEETEQAA